MGNNYGGTVPLFKTEERETHRRVGVKSSLVRVLHQRVVTAKRGPITFYLEPQKLDLTKAGG